MTILKQTHILCTLLIIGCVMVVSCTDQSINQVEVDESVNFQEFQQTLNAVFMEATKRIERNPFVNPNTVALNLKEAYIDVLGDDANMVQFKRGREEVTSGNSEASDKLAYTQIETLSETIIRSSSSPVEALDKFDEYLSDDGLSDQERIELIAGKEFILFLTSNSKVIEQSFTKDLLARVTGEEEEREESDPQEDDEGWWESWGRCAAGTVGGAITAGAAGCWGGATSGIWVGPKGAVTGCAVGGTVAAIGGALVGAQQAC